MKVGIIGTGNTELAHLFAYSKIKGIDIVCASNEGSANASFDLYKCKNYDTYKQMIDHNELDAISICTPPFGRADMIEYAAEANVNILCEPPIAESYSEALQIKKIIERNGIQLMMGFSSRFSNWYQTAKQLIRDGKLGDIIFTRWVYASRLPQNPWFLYDKEEDSCIQDQGGANRQNLKRYTGGIIIDRGCHIFDLLGMLFDLPRMVDATFLNKRKMSVEENAFITLEHPNSISQVALSYGTNIHANRPMERIEIYGIACNLILDHSLGVCSFLPASKHILSEYLLQIPKAAVKLYLLRKNLIKKDDPLVNQINYFCNCIERGEDITPNYNDGINNVAVTDACYQSIKENKKIVMKAVIT